MSKQQASGAGAEVRACPLCQRGDIWQTDPQALAEFDAAQAAAELSGDPSAEADVLRLRIRELEAQLLEAELNCGETTGRNLELEAQLRGMEQERANESRHYKGRIAELESAVNTLRRMGECLKCVTHKKEIEKLNGLVEFHKSEHTANLDLIAERDAAREEREVLAGDCERLKEKLHKSPGFAMP